MKNTTNAAASTHTDDGERAVTVDETTQRTDGEEHGACEADARAEPSGERVEEEVRGPASRRAFFVRSGLAALGGLTASAWMPKASAQVTLPVVPPLPTQHTLVILFLRGGCDGLSMVAPRLAAGGPDLFYEAQRQTPIPGGPQLAIPTPAAGNGVIGLTDASNVNLPWMLSEGAASAAPMFNAGALAFVHGVGSPVEQNGSHFYSQDYIEDGTQIGGTVFSDGRGWAGRSMALYAPPKLLRGIGYSKILQRTLFGAPKTVAIPDPTNYGLGGALTSEPLRRLALEYLHNVSDDPLKSAAADSLATLAEINAPGIFTKPSTATYPNTPFGTQLKRVQQMIQASADPSIALNLEAIMLDYGDWDNHANLGSTLANGGGMHNRMKDVFDSLYAMYQDLLTHAPTAEYTFVFISEFGRRITANGDAGVDHGRGSLMAVLGSGATVAGRAVYTMQPPAIAGGQGVLPGWNGLQAHSELQGGAVSSYNMIANIDYRRVLGEIYEKRLQFTPMTIGTSIFPGYAYKRTAETSPLGVLM